LRFSDVLRVAGTDRELPKVVMAALALPGASARRHVSATPASGTRQLRRGSFIGLVMSCFLIGSAGEVLSAQLLVGRIVLHAGPS
jgi:hypothetical protein